MTPVLFFDELITPIGKIDLLATKDELFNIYLKGKPKNITVSKKKLMCYLLLKNK